MAPQRFDKIESAPGNGRVSAASTHKIWYTGARLPRPTPADVSRAGGTPREEGAARGSAPVVGSARASTRVVGGLGHGITSDTTSCTILRRHFGSSHDTPWAFNEQRRFLYRKTETHASVFPCR